MTIGLRNSPALQEPIVLGINPNHDASAAVFANGKCVGAIATERVTRRKHDPHRVQPAVSYLLKRLSLDLDDIDLVVMCIVGMPEWLSRAEERDFHSTLLHATRSHLVVDSHHFLHAFSVIAATGAENGIVMVSDGIGSDVTHLPSGDCDLIKGDVAGPWYECMTLWRMDSRRLIPLRRYATTHKFQQWSSEAIGLGQLYCYASRALFGSRYHAGKLMALAAFGDASNVPSFLAPQFSGRGVPVESSQLPRFGAIVAGSDPMRYADVAARVQTDVEMATLRILRDTLGECDVTPSMPLCLCGGVALNCCLNRRLVQCGMFASVLGFPACTDDGIAYGAAAYGSLLRGAAPVPSASPYLGGRYSEEEIATAIDDMIVGEQWRVVDYGRQREDFLNACAEFLASGRILAWFQGASEFGPRALGNRSILADPRVLEHKTFLNAVIKQREYFRPFAPSIPTPLCEDWFDVRPCQLTDLMLLTARVHSSKQPVVPAICHVDGTARVHTVAEGTNALFYDLLVRFEAKSKVPILLNTSLNTRGEPIVESPRDCLELLRRSAIDGLAIGAFLITRQGE